jgi:hypothetical protein
MSKTKRKPVSKPKAAAKPAPKRRAQLQPLAAGQVWRMAELNLQVGLVGKLLVHYKLAAPNAVRVSNSVGGRAAVEKYLKSNKAVLVKTDKSVVARLNKNGFNKA